MSLPLTPEIVEAAYEFLRTTPPFKRWKLPPGEELSFRITMDRNIHGRHVVVGSDITLEVSLATVGTCHTLLETVAHEMVHIHQQLRGMKINHGAEFIRCARMVCKYHGFDFKRF